MADPLIPPGSNGPTRGDFEAAVREIVLARQKAETAQAGLRNAFKRAQGKGLDLKQLKTVLAMRDMDPVEVEQEQTVLRRYMTWAGLPIGAQVEMFTPAETGEAAKAAQDDGLTDEERHAAAMFEAEQKGYRAGRHGEKMPDCNPFEAGSEAFTEFERGYWRGQEAIALEMKPKDAPKRRGRPPKRAPGGNAEDGPQDDAADTTVH